MYEGTKVLDVHGHVSVPQSSNALLPFLLATNTALPTDGPFTSTSEEDLRAAAADHVAYIDERNIDAQIIGPRPFLMLGWMEDHLLPVWTRYVNQRIHQQCSFFPDRFVGACQLPQNAKAPDASHCVPELERCVDEYGFVATYVSPDPDGRRTSPGMHDPYWFPLYERCQELGLPIIVHGTNCLDPRGRHVPHN